MSVLLLPEFHPLISSDLDPPTGWLLTTLDGTVGEAEPMDTKMGS